MTQLTDKMEKLRRLERWTVNCCPVVDEKAISYNNAIDKCIALVKAE